MPTENLCSQHFLAVVWVQAQTHHTHSARVSLMRRFVCVYSFRTNVLFFIALSSNLHVGVLSSVLSARLWPWARSDTALYAALPFVHTHDMVYLYRTAKHSYCSSTSIRCVLVVVHATKAACLLPVAVFCHLCGACSMEVWLMV